MLQVLVVHPPFIHSLPHSFLSTHALPCTTVLVLRGWQGARGTGLPSRSVIEWLRWKICEYAMQGQELGEPLAPIQHPPASVLSALHKHYCLFSFAIDLEGPYQQSQVVHHQTWAPLPGYWRGGALF